MHVQDDLGSHCDQQRMIARSHHDCVCRGAETTPPAFLAHHPLSPNCGVFPAASRASPPTTLPEEPFIICPHQPRDARAQLCLLPPSLIPHPRCATTDPPASRRTLPVGTLVRQGLRRLPDAQPCRRRMNTPPEQCRGLSASRGRTAGTPTSRRTSRRLWNQLPLIDTHFGVLDVPEGASATRAATRRPAHRYSGAPPYVASHATASSHASHARRCGSHQLHLRSLDYS